ncbi:MAG: amidase [Bacteroidota bacterium]|nr:amidase [Rhodothermia bacterium]MCS7155071.1 amidase [Bacteroidota bacterium]MDW8138752.1 amidase [Bacteroidota bacterium]MDW8286087.1 amidase [Bacteroidota bacterium]
MKSFPLDRRQFMGYFSLLGLSGTLFPGLLWAQTQGRGPITKLHLEAAAELAGLSFTEEERALMLEDLQNLQQAYERLRQVRLENATPPALVFNPLPRGFRVPRPTGPPNRRPRPRPVAPVEVPSDLENLAFLTIAQWASLLRSQRVSSEALTRMYLERLKRYDPVLQCVVTLTEELALEQARQADREIRSGQYRGPLHGIPWGAKDLLATKGIPTTWGTGLYRDQILDYDATVVERLHQAGAVLVAKLTLGELAWGDVWFGGTTRNPWNPEQGSSGSSAGSAAAVAAGLLVFSVGSETLGSIVSPSSRCGATGLRPTFGRVSRYGAMALSWSMDKLGPICRSVEDCALVLAAIQGPDGRDPSVVEAAFDWDRRPDYRRLRVGYLAQAFEADYPNKRFDEETLRVLRQDLGLELVPVSWPDLPVQALRFILDVEAAAAFDEITRDGRIRQMRRQGRNTWPNTFRYARLIPAVEYVQANRLRTRLIEETARVFEELDVVVSPSFGGGTLLLTNLTGHPCVVLPNGFREDGTPTSITFIGKLFGEVELLSLAMAYQDATDFHRRHPPRFMAQAR